MEYVCDYSFPFQSEIGKGVFIDTKYIHIGQLQQIREVNEKIPINLFLLITQRDKQNLFYATVIQSLEIFIFQFFYYNIML